MCLSTHRTSLEKVWEHFYVAEFFIRSQTATVTYSIPRGKSEISGPRRACSHRKCAFGATTVHAGLSQSDSMLKIVK